MSSAMDYYNEFDTQTSYVTANTNQISSAQRATTVNDTLSYEASIYSDVLTENVDEDSIEQMLSWTNEQTDLFIRNFWSLRDFQE